MTTAQRFYYTPTDQDFTASGELDIRKLGESAPGSSSFQAQHPNSASTTQITLDPYTNRSAQGDVRANAGWAINAAGADGMEGDANNKRIIPSGTWTFTISVALPQAGTLTGTLTVSARFAVYRVASDGTRTLLFSANSGTVQSTGLGAANGLLTATSSQSQITLEPGETIHVGILSNLVQVGGTLGATVAGTATYTVGTTTQYVQVPTPGVRTERIRGMDDTVTEPTDDITRVVAANRTLTDTNPTTDDLDRQLVMSRTLTDNVPTTDELNRSVGLNRTLTEDLTTGGGGTTVINETNIFMVSE